MKRIWSRIAAWLARPRVRACAPDPLAGLGPRELADLPAYHPPRERAGD